MQARLVTIAAPCTIECAAGDPKGPPKFHAVAYSGGLIPGYTAKPALKHPYAIDLQGMTAARKVLANLDHVWSQRVGHATSVANDKRQVVLDGLLSAATSFRQTVADSARDGYEWETSIEAELMGVDFIAAGKSATVNGQSFKGPMYVVKKAKLTGVAFVSQGADEGNSVSIAAAKRNRAMSIHDETETDPLIQGEAERLAEIEMVCKGKWRKQADRVAELKAQAINGEIEFNELRAGVLQALRDDRHKDGDFNQGSRESGASSQVLECALARSAGMLNREKLYDEQTLEAADRHFKSFGLQQLLLTAACSNGYDGRPGERLSDGNLRRVLKCAFRDDDDGYRGNVRASQFSSISVPGILGNVANKEILQGFNEEDQAWREISRIASANDFKLATSYRMTDATEYEEVPKGGEIAHGSLGEESYTRQAKTYAKMLGLDRTDIINDDLGAFDDLRIRIGRGAAKKLNTVFWTRFLGGKATLFPVDSSKTNYLAGATTTLLVDGVGLELAAAHFNKMTSSDGKRIGGQATILLCPPELYFIARRFYISAGLGSATATPTSNIFENLFKPVVVPQLSDSAYNGYSVLHWFLFRSPSILAPMCVSFLNGQQTPTVESTDADFNQLGIMFRGYHDFGADLCEFGSGIMVKAAA